MSKTEKKDIGLTEVARSNDKFASALLTHVKGKTEENLVTSPFSVSTVLSMILPGARGETEDQLLAGLHYQGGTEKLLEEFSLLLPLLKTNKNFTLETANSGFVMKDYEMKQEYQETLRNYFQMSFQYTDFNKNEDSARLINNWVKDYTKGKIQDLFSPSSFNNLTRIVLVNAIYFKGDWDIKFDASQTKKSSFYPAQNSKEKIQVDMMTRKAEYEYAHMDDYSMIELPYKGRRVMMEIILPKPQTTLEDAEKAYERDTKEIGKYVREDEIILHIPKFKIESEIPLTETLEDMGMTDMFSQAADLSGIEIDASKMLYVSEVKQKAFIEVKIMKILRKSV